MLKKLFAESTNNSGAASRGNQLGNTARLTQISTEIAKDIIKKADNDAEQYQSKVVESQESHDAMDSLINELHDLKGEDIQFLKEEDAEVLDRMIKSQQSKRSRAKSREMTLDNYVTMMTGAVAENLLRIAANKPKSAGGGGARRTSARYTAEELEIFVDDPEALKRAIRNVQSKKSIYKNKAGFDPESDRWSELLEVEEELKAIRDGHSIEAEKAIERNQQVEELLTDVETKDLKAAEAKDMLESIKQMLNNK